MSIPMGSPLSFEVVASATITSRQMLNLHNSSGLRCRPANATAEGSEVDMVALNGAAAAGSVSGATPGQVLGGFSGLTAGLRYYLATTPGAVSATPPAANGNVIQCVGKALSATELWFAPEPPITVVV